MRNFLPGLVVLTLIGCASGEVGGGATPPPDSLPAATGGTGGTGGTPAAGSGGTGDVAGTGGGAATGGSGGAPAPAPATDSGAPAPSPTAGQPDAQTTPPAPAPDAHAAISDAGGYPACVSDRQIYPVHFCYTSSGVPQLMHKGNYSCSICATQDLTPGATQQAFAGCTWATQELPNGQTGGVLCVASCDECR
jgi:hypothetical protein